MNPRLWSNIINGVIVLGVFLIVGLIWLPTVVGTKTEFNFSLSLAVGVSIAVNGLFAGQLGSLRRQLETSEKERKELLDRLLKAGP